MKTTTLKKATFIQGPPNSGKWALAHSISDGIQGTAIYLSPDNTIENFIHVLSTEIQVVYIDWPTTAKYGEQKNLAGVIKTAIENECQKDIFILSPQKPLKDLKEVIEDLTPELRT